jgi:hypothetical protein
LCEISTADETWRLQYDPKTKTTKFAMDTADNLTAQEGCHGETTTEDNAY